MIYPVSMAGTSTIKADKLLDMLSADGSGYPFLDTHADKIVINKK